MTDDFYPAGPAGGAQRELTLVSPSYKRHAWIAMLVLVAFALLYASLVGWFGFTLYRLGYDIIRGRTQLPLIGVALLSAFLLVFLSKALFAVKKSGATRDLEITEAEQPLLFAFLYRLADEAGAPRPHRVFLSSDVNAAVFYNVSFKNLLFPSQKNLEIGLGLVNALTLAELKAVLAHEFGHFAQRSMAVGRWVYTAQQIASHIVHTRDWFDRTLRSLSHTDIRIAWIGWILRMIIWSIRALLDTAFSLVVLAQRALSREMEMQADLVAVSLTGSDALIHALHRLHAADEAWDSTLSFASSELGEGRAVADLFAIQSRVTQHLRSVLDDETFGQPPPIPTTAAESHRIFQSKMAQPPRMWLTHPPGREREDNAKRRYVAAPLDDRPAWTLFQHDAALRAQVTAKLLGPAPEDKPRETPPIEDSLARLDKQWAQPRVDRRYRGAYLARSSVRDLLEADEPYRILPPPEQVPDALARLYPTTLATELKAWRTLEDELGTLEALQEGTLAPPDGMIRHRGRVLRKRDLAGAITELKLEATRAREGLCAHDKQCRATHVAAGAKLGQGWDRHLRALGALLHYAEHSEANLRDAAGHLKNVLAIVTADEKVSGREMKRLVAAANEVHGALHELFEQRGQLRLPADVTASMEIESWQAALPEQLGLPQPARENIGVFLNHVDDWLGNALYQLVELKRATLDALLVAEEHVARCVREAADPGLAPTPAATPASYTVMPPGKHRARQKRLHWWDRFQLGDGLVASLARLVVAGGIIALVLGVSRSAGDATIDIINGLSIPVEVRIDGAHVTVAALGHEEITLPLEGERTISAHTVQGELVESFKVTPDSGAGQYFYNVAGATPLVEWTALYTAGAPEVPERSLGNLRFGSSNADAVFEAPPQSVSGRGSQTRLVLAATTDDEPETALDRLNNDTQKIAMIEAHARFDDAQSKYLSNWLGLALQGPSARAIVEQRIKRNPRELISLRTQQDVTTGEAHALVCKQHKALADAAPDDADFQYLTIRCMEETPERDKAFIAAYEQHSDNPWLAWAAGQEYAEQARWKEALEAFKRAFSVPSLAETGRPLAARVARVLHGRGELVTLEHESPRLHSWLVIERGSNELPAGPMHAYSLLAKGLLEQAISKAEPQPNLAARIVRFAATSDAASPELVERALALPADEGLDQSTVWSAIALASLHHHPIEPFMKLANETAGEHTEQMLRFLHPAKLGKGPLEEALGLDPVLRGHALVMATIVLGEKAHASWAREASALLFAMERPYLGY